MKYSKVALSVLGVIALAGCDSDDGASTPIEGGVQSRQVNLNVVATDDVPSIESVSYQHYVKLDGYTIEVDELDDGGKSTTYPDIDVSNGINHIIDITGKAKITVTHNLEASESHLYSEYGLRGSTSVDAADDTVSVTLLNKDFDMVVVHNSNDLYNATLNGEQLNADNGYNYAYITEDANLVMSTPIGNATKTVSMSRTANVIHPYEINLNQDGSIIIGDPNWEGEQPIEPVQPVVESSQLVKADILGFDFDTGAVDVEIKRIDATANIEIESGKVLGDFDFAFKADLASYHIDLYLGEDGTWGDKLIFMTDHCSGWAFVPAGTTSDCTNPAYVGEHIGDWNQVKMSKYATMPVAVNLEAGLRSGNFFVRLNDSGNFTGNIITIQEFTAHQANVE